MPHQTKRIWCKTHKKMVTAYRDFNFWWATCGCDSDKGLFKKIFEGE